MSKTAITVQVFNDYNEIEGIDLNIVDEERGLKW